MRLLSSAQSLRSTPLFTASALIGSGSISHRCSETLSAEYYLVDLVEIAVRQGHTIPTVSASLDEVLGVNDRVQLAQAEALMRRRILERLMLSGVTITDPASTFIEANVQIGQDTV